VTEGKHTPGPWRIAGKGTIRKGNNDWIADVHWRNREANARLISAAPELLSVLTAIHSELVSQDIKFGPLIADAEAVIAKATGAS